MDIVGEYVSEKKTKRTKPRTTRTVSTALGSPFFNAPIRSPKPKKCQVFLWNRADDMPRCRAAGQCTA